MIAVVVVADLAMEDAPVARPGVMEKLLDLMAADVHQDAAVLRRIPKPRRPSWGVEAMRPEADHLHHASDGAMLNQITCRDRGLDVQALGVIGGVDTAGLGDLCPSGVELI